jgi:hypothetical protein
LCTIVEHDVEQLRRKAGVERASRALRPNKQL